MLLNAVLLVFALAAVAGLAFVYGLNVGRRRGEDAVRDREAWYERESEQARHELETARRRHDEMREQSARLRDELGEARAQMRQLVDATPAAASDDEGREALRQRLQELEQEHQRNARLREVDRSRMQQLRDELQRLEATLTTRDERIATAEREAAEARASLHALRASEASRLDVVRHADARSDRQRIADLEEELRARTATVERLAAELQAMEQSYASELRERDGEATSLRDSARAARDELQALHAERVEARERAGIAESEAAALRDEVAALSEQLQTERTRSVRLLSDRREREVALEAARAAARADDVRLQELIRQQEDSLQHLRAQLVAGEQATEAAVARDREARQTLSLLQAAVDGENQKLRVASENAAGLSAELRATLAALESERAGRAQESATLTAALGDARSRLQAREDDLAALQEQLDARAGALERLTGELARQQETAARQARERDHALSRLQRQLDDARAEALAAVQRREQAEKHRDSMLARAEHQGHLAATAAGEARRHAANAAELGAELQRHVELLAVARADLEGRDARAARTERDLRDEVRRLQTDLAEQRDAASTALKRLERSVESQRAAEQRDVERSHRIDELVREVDHLLDARERLQRDLHEREEQLRRMRSQLSMGDEPRI